MLYYMKGDNMKGTLYFVLLSMLITGCSKYQTPITKRNQLMLLSKQDELEIGKKDFKRILKNCKLSLDQEKLNMINEVGNTLSKVVKEHKYQWEFVLVENKNINATCLPGGKIIINTGLFRVIDNKSQLAAVLAHEMSHAIARHGNSRISRAKVINGFEAAGTIATGLINPFLIVPFIIAYETGTKQGIILPKSRLEEREADIIGLNLMHKAGYDLDEAVALLKNIRKVNKHKRNLKNSTHLSYDKRIKEIEKTIQKILTKSKINHHL